MKLQRFDVSPTPHLSIVCHSDLDVSGGREGEVAIKAYGSEEDLQVERDGENISITSRARCKIGCPRGTALTLKAIHGDARLRRVEGPIDGEGVHGNAVLKEVGPTVLTHVMGDLRVRSVSGDLKLDQVAGDLSARSVAGVLACGNVGGDLSGTFLEGGLQISVGGDSILKTDFAAEHEYTLTTGGDAIVRFPTGADVSVKVTAGGGIDHKVDWGDVSESSGMLSGRVGEGTASLSITAGGNVTLQSKADVGVPIVSFALEEEDLELELESVAEEIERSIEAHMARLNAQLEAKLSRIDHEAVRRKVERAADKARRKAERAAEQARLKAERAQRRWERVGPQRPTRPTPPRRPSEPITEQERLTILRMVQEGKISTEEAAQLLEAMEG